MNSKTSLMLLTIFYFSKGRTPFSNESLSDFKVILSRYMEIIISEDEFLHIIDVLCEDKSIERKGNNYTVRREGEALVNSISKGILGEANINRLINMCDDYKHGKTAYIQEINRSLEILPEIQQNKITSVSLSSIKSVGLILKLKYKQSLLYQNSFEIDYKTNQNSDIDAEINRSEKSYSRVSGFPCLAYKQDNKLNVFSFTPISSFSLADKNIRFLGSYECHKIDIANWNLKIISFLIDKILRKLGYTMIMGGYINYRNGITISSNLGFSKEYQTYRLTYDLLEQDNTLIWVDSSMATFKRVLDMLHENLDDFQNATREQILDCLSGLKLRSIPFGKEVEVVDVRPSIDLTKETVPTKAETYYKYWNNSYRISLSAKVQPLIIIKSDIGELSYPAETLYIDRYSLQNYYDDYQQRKPHTQTPQNRYEVARDLFLGLKDSAYNPLSEFVEIDFENSRIAPSLKQINSLGMFKDAISISSPVLKFQNNISSLDPKDIFKYGPYCGRKNLTLTHLILPQTYTDENIQFFISSLSKSFRLFAFGQINSSVITKIIRYNVHDELYELEKKLRNLVIETQKDSIAIAVFPEGNEQYRYSLKRLFPDRTQVPLQLLQATTFNEILDNSFRGFRYLCLQLLIKSLKKGESIWNLVNSAGLSSEDTLFIGIGFSRDSQQKRVSKCATVLHDSHGHRVYHEIFPTITPEERTINKQWFDLILKKIQDVIDKEKPTRLVFYRKGKMDLVELDAVISSINSHTWLSTMKFTFVSIMDMNQRRFYIYEQYRSRNLPPGYAIIINDKEAFLSTSNYDDRQLRQGTVVPIQLKLEIGSDDIVDIVKEYHDLTYLSWQAPNTTSKYPLVVSIADKFAELAKGNVPTNSMFYLDL